METLTSTQSLSRAVRRVYLKEQGFLIARSVYPIVLQVLRGEDRSYDSLLDKWNTPFTLKTKEGELEVRIIDLERFFNLNCLRDNPKCELILRELLYTLNVDVSKKSLIMDWIAKKTDHRIDSLEELRYAGLSEEEINKLREVCTTFSSKKININTAKREVLLSLSPQMDESVVDEIIRRRLERPLKSLNELALFLPNGLDLAYQLRDVATTRSRFFKVVVSIKVKGVRSFLEVIYDRDLGKVVAKRIY